MLSINVQLPVETRDSINAAAAFAGELSNKRNVVVHWPTGDSISGADPFMTTAQAQAQTDFLLNAVQQGVVSIGAQQIQASETEIIAQSRVETEKAVRRRVYPIIAASMAISVITVVASLGVIFKK